MSTRLVDNKRMDCWLILFLLAHLLVWTLVPAFARYNLPLDSVEGAIWGHQLEWGYDKNPFLNAWLTALALHFDTHANWLIYLFSQFSVMICLIATWLLARKMLPPIYAMLSVMILEGVQYYNFHAIDFNDNTLELSLFALTIYFFYRALKSPAPTTWAWVFTGLFAGLSMMAKYYTLALLASMTLFLFSRADNRKQLKTLPPYLGLLIFIIIIFPHTIWLFFHDFITVKYVIQRGSSAPSWTNRFVFPAIFAWEQFKAFLPAALLAATLMLGKKTSSETSQPMLSTFNKSFLFYVGLLPFILTILLSLLFGTHLRAGWGMPLLSTWGILLFGILQPALTREKIRRFIAIIFGIMLLLSSSYYIGINYSAKPTSSDFPGREIALKLTQTWRDHFHTKLEYVAGSRWVTGNINVYSPDHPAVFIQWDKILSPWIDLAKLQKKGGIFVWLISHDEILPEEIRKQFPNLKPPTIMEFNWHRNIKTAPIKIGVAMLPPRVT